MDADLAVGPVIQRPPASGPAVLHVPEHVLDNVLTVVTLDELLGRPRRIVADYEFLAQVGLPDVPPVQM